MTAWSITLWRLSSKCQSWSMMMSVLSTSHQRISRKLCTGYPVGTHHALRFSRQTSAPSKWQRESRECTHECARMVPGQPFRDPTAAKPTLYFSKMRKKSTKVTYQNQDEVRYYRCCFGIRHQTSQDCKCQDEYRVFPFQFQQAFQSLFPGQNSTRADYEQRCRALAICKKY